MATYRVFMSRTVTSTEHRVVVVQSSSEAYAAQDAICSPDRWESDGNVTEPSTIIDITKIGEKR